MHSGTSEKLHSGTSEKIGRENVCYGSIGADMEPQIIMFDVVVIK